MYLTPQILLFWLRCCTLCLRTDFRTPIEVSSSTRELSAKNSFCCVSRESCPPNAKLQALTRRRQRGTTIRPNTTTNTPNATTSNPSTTVNGTKVIASGPNGQFLVPKTTRKPNKTEVTPRVIDYYFRSKVTDLVTKIRQ